MELPFNTPEFAESWAEWIEYKKQEFNFKYKSEISMKKALKKLHRLSGGSETKAIEIIDEAIANGWKGHFALKAQPENKKKSASDILFEQLGINQ